MSIHVFCHPAQLHPDDLVKEGLLREDLLHRLQVVALDVPGLAKRRDDIPLLVEFYISAIAEQINVAPRKAGHDVMAVLQSHNWPGNVRQLRNCVEHTMLNSIARQSDVLTIEMLPKEIVSETDVSEQSPVRGILCRCLCAKRVSGSSVNIWLPRLTGSAEMCRARPNLLVWSARHCMS